MTKQQQCLELLSEAQRMIKAAMGIIHPALQQSDELPQERIIRVCAEVFEADIRNPSKTLHNTEARFAAALLLREITDRSLSEIAKAIGKADHGTAAHAVKRGRELCEVDSVYRAKVDRVRRRLKT